MDRPEDGEIQEDEFQFEFQKNLSSYKVFRVL